MAVPEKSDRMALQGAEFTAMAGLAEQWSRITLTPIVDDDYPEVRYDYETALDTFIKAMRDNGRFAPGNRYGLKEL